MGCIYNGVCSSLVALFSWQQVTNLAAVMAHCGISPSRYGSLSKLDLSLPPSLSVSLSPTLCLSLSLLSSSWVRSRSSLRALRMQTSGCGGLRQTPCQRTPTDRCNYSLRGWWSSITSSGTQVRNQGNDGEEGQAGRLTPVSICEIVMWKVH